MIPIINRIVRKAFFMLGYVPAKVDQPKILRNVFSSSHSKSVLLSYIQSVFSNPESRNDRAHTNRYTTYLIAEVLHELGYKVDVINYDDASDFEIDKYQLIIGLGLPLETALTSRKDKTKTKVIWFGTGCNPLFSNVATLERLKDFYNRHGKLAFSSSRYILKDWPLQHELADWIILHGSEFARKTYHTNNISCIHAPVFIYHEVIKTEREWQDAQKNYLWFGVGGLVHKGLDLVIDAIRELKDCNLHICGTIEGEKEFYEMYKPVIDAASNITYHGFVDVKSEAFEKILRNCVFTIFPSTTEGNSPSVITCMANGGLIPIVSQGADIQLNSYGIQIENLSPDAVIKAVKQAQTILLQDLKNQSNKIMEVTRKQNSFEYFKEDFKLKLQEAVSKS